MCRQRCPSLLISNERAAGQDRPKHVPAVCDFARSVCLIKQVRGNYDRNRPDRVP